MFPQAGSLFATAHIPQCKLDAMMGHLLYIEADSGHPRLILKLIFFHLQEY